MVSRVFLIFLGIVVFILILGTGAVYAYKDQFAEKAFFGTKIIGEDVGGKTKQEVEEIISKKTSQIEFSFFVDGENIVAKPADAGLKFNVSKSAERAITRGKSGDWYEPWVYAGASLVYKVTPVVSAEGVDRYFSDNVDIDYEINKEKLGEFTNNLSVKFNTASQNASLIVSGTEVQVVPAVYGRKIVTDSLALQIIDGIKKAESPSIKIEFEKVNPEIIEKDTAESIAAAKKIIETPVVFTYKGKTYSPDRKTIGGWINFKEKDVLGKKKLVPEADPVLISKYLFVIGQEISIPAVNRKVTIKNGAEQVVDQEGKDGLAVDYNRASLLTATKLNSSLAVSLEIPTYVVKSKTQVNNILVADWSKYIEVNISTQTMCAYLAGGVKQNCWAITTGDNSHKTPTGTFLISRKSGAGGVAGGPGGGGVCMPNPPSSTPLCGINYVSTFTPQGHAIHEAWWRSNFGQQNYKWNGSHGCVNSPYDVAKWIYYWAPIGTPVIIHY